MNKKDSIQSITNDLKTILLKAKKEIKQKNDELKNTKNVHQLTKKEYQALCNEHSQLKKKLAQYEEYFKSAQIQKKKRNEREREKQEIESLKRKRQNEEEFSILNEIKKLKKLDLESLLAKKTKKRNQKRF